LLLYEKQLLCNVTTNTTKQAKIRHVVTCLRRLRWLPTCDRCLHRTAWPRKPTPRIKQHVSSYHTGEVIERQKV